MVKDFLSERSRWRLIGQLMMVGVGSLIVFTWMSRLQRPRARQVDLLPVAFWAWQNETPEQGEVEAAIDSMNAGVLFVRAGQIDIEKAQPRRIREAQGRLPRRVDVHLVYNATRRTLAEFEHLELKKLAATLADAFQSDCRRALNDGAVVVGLQLDFDVPTRLLGRYAELIRVLRCGLQSNAQVSITGLPTWMSSSDFSQTLAEVSFWVPQCYGAMIPQRLDTLAPIASPSAVADWIDRASQLQRPFYAGLSAYGYAIHYERDGQLIEVRGDLGPSLIANQDGLELVERQPFDARLKMGEWRYVYRARSDIVIDGLGLRSGEYLMVDLPSVESLRQCVRAVGERAGEQLLGLCLFRLPGASDKANLSLKEVVCAVKDESPSPQIEIQIAAQKHSQEKTSQLTITIINNGSTSTLLGEDALTLEVGLPEGSLRAVTTDGLSRGR